MRMQTLFVAISTLGTEMRGFKRAHHALKSAGEDFSSRLSLGDRLLLNTPPVLGKRFPVLAERQATLVEKMFTELEQHERPYLEACVRLMGATLDALHELGGPVPPSAEAREALAEGMREGLKARRVVTALYRNPTPSIEELESAVH